MAESPIMTKRAYVGEAQPILPVPLSSVDAWYFDPAAGTPQVRNHSGKVWSKDHTRTGSVREMQPFRSYLFNGTGDLVRGTSYPSLGSAFSVCAWIRVTNYKLYPQIISGDAAGFLEFRLDGTSGRLALTSHSPSYVNVVAPDALPLNTFIHVAATWDSGTVTLYQNGEVVQTDSTSPYTTPTVNPTPITLGARHNGSFPFEGQIFGVHVLDEAVNQSTIQDIMQQSTSDNLLVRYWCDETAGDAGTNSVAFDSSGNANHGTITAASLANFHDEPTTAPAGIRSPQNEIGYTEGNGSNGAAVGVFIPLVSPTTDALGNAAQYSGPCPHDGRLLGPCATFNGFDDFAQSGAMSVTGDWTVSFRANPDVSEFAYFGSLGASHPGSFALANSLNGQWFFWDGLSVLSASALSVDTWYHLAIVKSGTTYTLYKDGEIDGTGTMADIDITKLTFGKRADNALHYDGQACDIAVHSVAKSQAEIQAIMSGTVDDTGLVERWHMQEPTGIVHVGRNGNDLDVSTASQANYHANQQDVFDYLTTANGKRNAGQTVDIFGGAATSPYALELAGLSVSQLQSFGDDDEPADPNTVVFAKVDAGGDGPIIVDVDAPGDTPQTTTLQGYT